MYYSEYFYFPPGRLVSLRFLKETQNYIFGLFHSLIIRRHKKNQSSSAVAKDVHHIERSELL